MSMVTSFHIPCACANYCAWRVASEMRHVLFEKALAGKCCDTYAEYREVRRNGKVGTITEREFIRVCRIILAR